MRSRKKKRRTWFLDRLMKNVPKKETGGVALILVVWMLVVLTAVVGEFSYSMRTEINIAKNFKEEEEAYQSALAGIEQAKVEILSVKDPAIVYYNESNVLMFGTDNEEEPVRADQLGNAGFKYVITDEDGKVNINTAPLERLKYIFGESGVDVTEVDTIVDSIVDWRDTNDLHMLNGAEEDYYTSLDNPYSCKDGPFDHVEELLLVKGMNEEILYGSKEEDGDEEKAYEGVERYLTVYGSDTVNINTASRIALEALFGIETANNLISQRETAPIASPVSGGKVSSEIFTIVSTGKSADGKIKRSVKITVKKMNKELETLYWNDNYVG